MSSYNKKRRAKKVLTRTVNCADQVVDRVLTRAERRGLSPQVRYTMNTFDKKAKKVLKYAEKKLDSKVSNQQQDLSHLYPPPPTPPPPGYHNMGSSTPYYPPPPGYPGNGSSSSGSKPHRKKDYLSSSGYPKGTKPSSKHKHSQKPPKGYPKPPKGYPNKKYSKHNHGHKPYASSSTQNHPNGKQSLQGKIASKISDPAFQAQAVKFVKKKVAKELINGFSSH